VTGFFSGRRISLNSKSSSTATSATPVGADDPPLLHRRLPPPCGGVELLFCCWLLVGQRFSRWRRQRSPPPLNILGAYCPEDHEYLDLRLTRDNINGEQFVKPAALAACQSPRGDAFHLVLGQTPATTNKAVVKEWLARHGEFELKYLPTYSSQPET